MVNEIKKSLIFWLIPVVILGFWYLRLPLLAVLIGSLVGFSIQTIAFYLNYKIKVNYYLGIFLIYFGFIVLISFSIYLTFNVLAEKLPELFNKLQPYLKKLDIQPINFPTNWQNLVSLGNKYLHNFFGIISNIFDFFVSLILILIVSLYVAFDKNLSSKMFKFFSTEKREEYEKVWRMIKRKVAFWFMGQIVLMIFIGVFSYIFVGPILRIENAAVIGLLAGILEIVPIVGPIFSLIIASLITLLDKPELTFFVIGYFILLQQIENHFLVPLVMRRAISLNPILVIIGILIGSKIGGVLGIIAILPILGMIGELMNFLVLSRDSAYKVERKLF